MSKTTNEQLLIGVIEKYVLTSLQRSQRSTDRIELRNPHTSKVYVVFKNSNATHWLISDLNHNEVIEDDWQNTYRTELESINALVKHITQQELEAIGLA